MWYDWLWLILLSCTGDVASSISKSKAITLCCSKVHLITEKGVCSGGGRGGNTKKTNGRPDLENICTKCNLHCSNRGTWRPHALRAWVTATLADRRWRNFSSRGRLLPCPAVCFLSGTGGCGPRTWCRFGQIRRCRCSVRVHPDQRGAVHKRLWGSVIHNCTFPLISSCRHRAKPFLEYLLWGLGKKINKIKLNKCVSGDKYY